MMRPDHALAVRMIKVLDLIAAEFESDPMSVQCFDLRTVEEAKAVVRERRQMERDGDLPHVLTGPRPMVARR